jgi:hypothetical protein
MENNEKVTKEVKESFVELDKRAKSANERLRVFLKDLGKADMKESIEHLNLSDDSLNFLCEGIALETEDYEICAAVTEIKKERLALELMQATYSPINHYHTDLPKSGYLHLASD